MFGACMNVAFISCKDYFLTTVAMLMQLYRFINAAYLEET